MTTTVPIATDQNVSEWKRFYLVPSVVAILPVGGLVIAKLFSAAVIVSVLLWLLVFYVLKRIDGSHRVTFTLGEGRLKVDGDFFADTFSLSELDVEHAEIADLTRDTQHALRWKTMGMGMPGYYSGEYTLKSGRPALVFVADRTRVLLISRGREPVLLLSVPDPLAFKSLLVEAKRQVHPTPAVPR